MGAARGGVAERLASSSSSSASLLLLLLLLLLDLELVLVSREWRGGGGEDCTRRVWCGAI